MFGTQTTDQFFLDLKILLQTIGKVVKRDEVSAKGDATIPTFRGYKSSSLKE